jgi:hypothetical protein
MSIWRASQAVSQFERVYAVALDPRLSRGRCGGLCTYLGDPRRQRSRDCVEREFGLTLRSKNRVRGLSKAALFPGRFCDVGT